MDLRRKAVVADLTWTGERFQRDIAVSVDEQGRIASISGTAGEPIRLVLIQTYYATGAIGKPLEGAQQRFSPRSREEFVSQMDRIASRLDAATQTLAIACHSIRAVTLDDLRYFRDYAARNHMPFHI